MTIQTPDRVLVERIFAEQAARRPTKASVTVIGDSGLELSLPLILGTPTREDWHAYLSAHADPERRRKAPEDLARACVLFPDAPTLDAWISRWPAIGRPIADQVLRLAGGDALPDTQPWEDAEALAESEDILREHAARHPVRVRARVLEGEQLERTIALVLATPSRGAWSAFQAASSEPARFPTAAEALAKAHVLYPEHFGELLEQWQGLGLQVVAHLGKLAGSAAKVELGNW